MNVSQGFTGSAQAWRAPRIDAASPGVLRALLLLGCAISVAVGASLGEPAHYLTADPELATLLRGMALIKAGLVLAAIGVLWWRFGRPTDRSMALAYVSGVSLMGGASALVWELTFIPLAALAFHVGLFMLLGFAFADRQGGEPTVPGLRAPPGSAP